MILNNHIEGDLRPDSVPLVVLHGLFGSWENWRLHLKRLAGQLPTVGLDVRNHGLSPRGSSMDYIDLAKDVQDTLKSLTPTPSRFHLLGHSMGGKIAMALASLMESTSDNSSEPALEKLIIVDIAPRLYEPTHHLVLEALNAINVATLPSRSAADKLLSDAVPDPNIRAFLLRSLVRSESEGYQWKFGLAELQQCYPQLLEPPPLPKQLKGKLLVIRGSDSPYVTAQDCNLFENLTTQARIHTIEGAGHWPHATHADEVTSELARFLT